MAIEAQDAELARMLQDKERAKARRARERAKQKKLERQQQLLQEQQQPQIEERNNSLEKVQRPDKLDLKVYSEKGKKKPYPQYPDTDPEEIQVLEDDPEEEIREVPNVAAMIDPTYNGNAYRNSSTNSSNTVSPVYTLPTPSPQEIMVDDIPCYMPIQGQRRNQNQSPQTNEEKNNKRRVKDGCKQQ